jgi:hypothetical protein
MVALCRQCRAPLTVADLGYDLCLTCHWQHIFDYADDPARAGELRLALRRPPGTSAGAARDRANRLWQRVPGDGQAWCTLCGATLTGGWAQGVPGGIQTVVCDEHVDWAA